MPKANGQSGVQGDVQLDVEHELPAAQNEAQAPAASSEELEQLRGERDALYERLARLQAEFDNFRKRTQREQADFREYAVTEAARALLPIVDSLERAVRTESKSNDLRAGVELILRQFHDALKKMGVQPVEAEGRAFDPNLHQAVEMVDREDVPDHQVIEELQRGYRIKDRLLRPAMVRVARNAKA